ncbi:MAG: hypothetical protein E3J72_11810 [Planctomycetota bacterium]|nr:MAG: hypothetical protein E3J72_11810 [Planctomycetota bacterium]
MVFLRALLAVVLAVSAILNNATDSSLYISLDAFCNAQGFKVSYDALTDRYILKKGAEVIVLSPGMSKARIGTETIELGGLVFIDGGRVLVPRTLSDHLREVRSRRPAPVKIPKSEFTIVLDPGHGPRWYGGISQNGLTENAVVLPIARTVQEFLQEKGYKVVLTRTTNAHLSTESRTDDLDARVNATYEKKGDLFVSIHANSTSPPNPAAVGIETFYYPASGYDSMSLERRAAAIAGRNLDVGHYSGGEFSGGARAKRVLCRTILEANASRSRNLAKMLQEEMVNATGNVDRGIKNTRDLRVLRMQLCPAALVEIGFLTNPKTERWLRTPSYREKIAAAIAKGIDSFVRTSG